MFNLDIQLFNMIYSSCCKALGSALGFSTFEGFIIYAGTIVWGVCEASNMMKKAKK